MNARKSRLKTNTRAASLVDYAAEVLRRPLSNVPLISLLAANTVPLWGVVFLGWDAFSIVLLYWAENVIVGFYNVLKIIFAKVEYPTGGPHGLVGETLGKAFFTAFFILHYCGFLGIHGIFILVIFGGSPPFPDGHTWPCFLVFAQIFVNVLRQMWLAMPDAALVPLAVLLTSHGISFVSNYLIKAERVMSDAGRLMGEPYSRVVVMHIAIIGGMMPAQLLKSPVPLLVLLVLLKTVLDAGLHLHQHTRLQLRTLPVRTRSGNR